MIKKNKFKGFDMYNNKTKRGVRFDEYGNLKGFLEM